LYDGSFTGGLLLLLLHVSNADYMSGGHLRSFTM